MAPSGKKTGRQGRGRGGQGDRPRTGPPAAAPQQASPQQGGAYDGAGSQRSRSASRTRSHASSRDPPATKKDSLPAGHDPEVVRAHAVSRNVDLGGGAYASKGLPTKLLPRPGFGTAGRPYKISVNSYEVTSWPTDSVYQYDIVIGSGNEKRGLQKAIWESRTVQDAIGPEFLWDGNKIGWSLKKLDRELRLLVDMDAEKGKPPRQTKEGAVREDKHRVGIKFATQIHLHNLQSYLSRQTDFEGTVLNVINFLDHLLRETPSKHLINLRRSYFSRNIGSEEAERFSVGNGVEAFKGVYQSLRVAEGAKLVINADVSNSCFWQESSLDHLAYEVSNIGNATRFQALSTGTRDGGADPPMYAHFKRLVKNKFFLKHRGREQVSKQYTVMSILKKTADTYKFDVTDPVTKKVTPQVSVRDYFRKKYNVILNKPWLPLIQAQRGEVYPMEICYMSPGQRYPFKLNEDQTAKMIKFAVSRPAQRRVAINKGLSLLNWSGDPMLKTYGMKINPNMIQTNARVLEPPEVLFAKGATAKPGYSGRWDLRGKVFLKPNQRPLKSWGVVVLSGSDGGLARAVPSQDQVKAFVQNFLKLYRGHGGIVEETNPTIIGGVPDTAKAIEAAFYGAGNKASMRPQMLLVIATNKSANVYDRVKKNCDCRWGIVSQVVLASNVVKNAPQYCSNVLMKFNCKIGGTTSAIKARKPFFTEPTMIIGADVSHPAPGISQVSIAAITVSMDTTASRYCAAVQSNGVRRELIASDNVVNMTEPLIQRWMETVGGGRLPKHVYYFRDGVSEGGYIPLIQNEVADLKLAFSHKTNENKDLMPKFTIVVAEKRHHIRFFPPQGPGADKNGNPVPGTIVDRDVTHPWENDVYLAAHSAIQGTSRPTHYQVIMDEANVPVDKFQALLYEHCYQYQRATTPVSLFPAVYYAHLAAARAYAHIDRTVHEAYHERLAREQGQQHANPRVDNQSEVPLLLPLQSPDYIQYSMWYI